MKVEIELKTMDKKEVPEILKEIGEKIKDGIDMSNAEKYFFQLNEKGK